MNALIAVATAEDGTNPGASVRLSDRFHPLNDLEGGAAVILKPHTYSGLDWPRASELGGRTSVVRRLGQEW